MKIVATFAYRYEPDWMIDQLRQNLGWVDGFAELNTRGRDDVWMPRIERTRALQSLARDMGADWVLAVDPDERLEPRAEKILRRLSKRSHSRYAIHLRELWTPTQYRTDGIWGRKWRRRFYRLGNTDEPRPVDVNLYHLKMIDAANRAERARVHTEHNTWDNRHRGFGYLTNEEGMTLETIPSKRRYSPPYEPYEFRVT